MFATDHAAAKLLLFFGLLGNALGHAFLFAAMPLLGRQMGLDDLQSGLLLGLGSLGLLLAAPLWGRVCESWGRRPVLLVGFTAAAFAPLSIGLLVQARLDGTLMLLWAFVLMLVVRLFQSLFTGGLLPAAQAYIADTTTAAQRTRGMGMLGAAFGLGGIVGTAVLWWAADNILIGFWLSSAFTGLALLLIIWKLPESAAVSEEEAEAQTKLPWRDIRPFLGITLIGVTSYAMVKQVAGPALQDMLGLDTQEALMRTGSVLTLSAVAMVFAQLVVLRFLRASPWVYVAASALLCVVGLLISAAAQSYAVFLAAMVILGISHGLLLPANLGLMSLSIGPRVQARVAGINAIAQGLGMVLGPVLGAALYQYSKVGPFWLMAFVYLALFFVILRGRRGASFKEADSHA